MTEKTAKTTVLTSESGQAVQMEVVAKVSAEELLLQAAVALEEKKGPRAPKTYLLLAEEVRALARRISEMG